MAGPPTPAFAQATWIFGGTACPRGAATTLGFTLGGGTHNDLADILQSLTEDVLEGMCSNDVTFTRLDVKRGPVETGPTVTRTLGFPGTQAAPACPPQVTTLVRKENALVTSRRHGRMNWPGVNEGMVTSGGSLDSSFRNDLQSKMDTFYDALITATFVPVVFSTLSSDPTQISEFVVSGRVATMRRRNRA